MTPDISDFMPGPLAETDKYIEVLYEHLITAKKTGEFQTKIPDDNGKPFIDMLYNVLIAPDFCNRLFSIIMLMNSGHN